MKTFIFALAAAVIFSLQFTNAQNGPLPIPGQYMVLLTPKAAKPVIEQQKNSIDRKQKEQLNRLVRQANLSKVKDVAAKAKLNTAAVIAEYADVVVGFTAKLTNAEVTRLKANPDVAGVYPDYRIQLEANSITPECMPEAAFRAQTTTCAITKAGGPVNGAGKPTWIWILDTGIDLTHPDLNVQTDATYAKSFISGQTVNDGHGHGTHVAGIAAAKNNTIGVVGVSSGATVVPVKVLANSGSGSFTQILQGVNHVAQYDIAGDVVNMSLGSYPVLNCENANPALRDAIRALGNAGTFVVIAAGNDAGNANLSIPGCINGTKIYTVGSITCSNTCSSFSNWGTPAVDWVAVGSDVYSTYKGGAYATMSGTSMAAPVVAGIIHSKTGAPVSAGNVICGGTSNKIAKR
ncbi:peptidase S8 [Sphingobacteriales bacterium UPWRP_1]|nr:hypothetical protein B6N25_09410 [Sphingobacteriales bacterium TSM_CSS]PSJ77498.1 peptidase S8 [Sphingobacteriales bacterium UPWRP_1]